MPTATLKCRCGCKQRARRETMLLTPGGAAFVDESHAASYAQKNYRKNQKAIAKRAGGIEAAFQKRKQEYKANDYSRQFSLTKKAAQTLANRLDQDLPCICCSVPRGSAQFCGGHFKTAGSHPELALDLRNIHGQRNSLCNKHKSGNIEGDKHSHGFKQGLVSRYGQRIVDYLDSYHPPRKFTCDELIALRKEYSAEIRRLEKGLPPSRDWRSIEQESRLSGRTEQEAGAKCDCADRSQCWEPCGDLGNNENFVKFDKI